MKTIPIPVSFLPLQLAKWEVSLESFQSTLGPAHFTEEYNSRTFGGSELNWAYEITPDQNLLLVYQVPYGHAIIMSDRDSIDPLLSFLGISRNSPGLSIYDRAYPV